MAIATQGGFEIVLAGMQAHPKHQDIQAQGCQILHQLSTNASNRVQIGFQLPSRASRVILFCNLMLCVCVWDVGVSFFVLFVLGQSRLWLCAVLCYEIVSAALANHPTSKTVCKWGRKVLPHLDPG